MIERPLRRAIFWHQILGNKVTKNWPNFLEAQLLLLNYALHQSHALQGARLAKKSSLSKF